VCNFFGLIFDGSPINEQKKGAQENTKKKKMFGCVRHTYRHKSGCVQCACEYLCVAEIHQNPINLSFKHFHFGSLRCAAFALNGNPYKGQRGAAQKRGKMAKQRGVGVGKVGENPQ